jgi:hypothetical protein
MKRLFIIGWMIAVCQCALSQDPALKRNYYLKASVWETGQSSKEAYVADVNDTALILSTTPVQFRRTFMNTSSVSYGNLGTIKLHRYGNISRGIGIGALIGGVTGGTIAVAANSRPCADCKGGGAGVALVAGTISGGFFGALIGVIVGAASEKRFVIGGNQEKFNKMRLSVLEMTYRKSR